MCICGRNERKANDIEKIGRFFLRPESIEEVLFISGLETEESIITSAEVRQSG